MASDKVERTSRPGTSDGERRDAAPSAKGRATPPEPALDLDLSVDELPPTRNLKEGFTGQER